RLPDSSTGCRIDFDANGNGFLSPALELFFNNGTSKSYAEIFSAEAVRPEISFDTVAIREINGSQYLTVAVNASDNTDISYLEFSVLGLRASDLRRAG